jgi:hypothetical protein
MAGAVSNRQMSILAKVRNLRLGKSRLRMLWNTGVLSPQLAAQCRVAARLGGEQPLIRRSFLRSFGCR